MTEKDIGSLVCEAIAASAELDAASLHASTRLLDTHMDSLTLVTVVCEIENAIGATFAPDELAEILRARDVGELVAAVEHKVGPERS